MVYSRIKIDAAGSIYVYSGQILDSVGGWVVIKDIKEGKIKLNKTHIISIQNME